MPTYQIEVNGQGYEIDAPTQPTRDEAVSYVAKATKTPVNTGTVSADAPPAITQIGERPAGGYAEADVQPSALDQLGQDLFNRVAHPRSALDMIGLLLPTDAGIGVLRTGADVAAQARAGGSTILKSRALGYAKDLLRTIRSNWNETSLEAASRKLVDSPIFDRYMPNIGSGSKAAVAPEMSLPVNMAPKPHFTAQDVMRIRSFMKQGVSEVDAIEAALKLNGASGDAMSQLLASPSFAKLNR